MKKVEALIITGYGINAEQELGFAFQRAGATVSFVHVHDLISEPARLDRCSILGFPGGFSFGDHLGSGKVLSHLLKKNLGKQILQFLADESKLALGICNGFQTIAKMGMVPNLSGTLEPEISLLNNTSGNFIDRWVHLRTNPDNTSPWLKGISGMRVPIRHGEGRMVARDSQVESDMLSAGLAAFYYEGENPNGSWMSIAGISDKTGRALGMMPHPEAFIYTDQSPGFRRGYDRDEVTTDGLRLFLNGVSYCQDRL